MTKSFFVLALAGMGMLAACKSGAGPEEAQELSLTPAELLERKRVVLAAGYSDLDTFSVADGLAVAIRDGKYGYIDTSGKEVVPLVNDFASPFSDGLGLVGESEGKEYFVDKTGKKVIDLAGYEGGFPFADGYATVRKGDFYGLIDKTGKEVIPCSATSGIFPVGKGNFLFEKDGKKSVVNAQGQPALPFGDFTEIYYDAVNDQYALGNDRTWVIKGADGAEKVKVDAEGLIYRDGMYFVNKNSDSGTVAGVMNGKGEMVVPYGKYFSINTSAADGRICVGIKTGERPESDGVSVILMKVGYVDLSGKEVIPMDYQDIMGDFSEGLAAVMKNGKMGFIDPAGKMVIPATYDKAESFRNGLARVTTGEVVSYIDKTGKPVL